MTTEEKIRKRMEEDNEINLFNSGLQNIQKEELKILLKDILEEEVDEKYYLSNEKVKKLIGAGFRSKKINNTVRSGGRGSEDIKHTWDLVKVGNVNPSGRGMNGNVYQGDFSPTITTNKGEGIKMVLPVLTPDRLNKRQNGRRFKEDGDPSFTLNTQDRHGILQVNNPKHSNDRIYSDKGISPTLNTMQGGNRAPFIYMNNETWKDIKEWDGYYQISSFGRLKSLKRIVNIGKNKRTIDEKIIKLNMDKYGYHKATLTHQDDVKYTTIHRLVAEAFIPNPENKNEINHKDGNKLNNKIDNLEWVTTYENQKHRRQILRKHGSKDNIERGAVWNKEHKKWASYIKIDNKTKFLGYFNAKEDAQEKYYDEFVKKYKYTPWDRQPFIIDDTQGFDGIREYKDTVPTLRSQRSGLKVAEQPILTTHAIMIGNLSRYTMKYPRSPYCKDSRVSWCVDTSAGNGVSLDGITIRKLTPKECFRLQGFLNDEVVLDGLSNTQQYKLAGNGQSVNVVRKIFISLFLNNSLPKDL